MSILIVGIRQYTKLRSHEPVNVKQSPKIGPHEIWWFYSNDSIFYKVNQKQLLL